MVDEIGDGARSVALAPPDSIRRCGRPPSPGLSAALIIGARVRARILSYSVQMVRLDNLISLPSTFRLCTYYRKVSLRAPRAVATCAASNIFYKNVIITYGDSYKTGLVFLIHLKQR